MGELIICVDLMIEVPMLCGCGEFFGGLVRRFEKEVSVVM